MEYIASLVREGFRAGFYPNWTLECEEFDALEESDLEIIGNLIETGFVKGEVSNQAWSINID